MQRYRFEVRVPVIEPVALHAPDGTLRAILPGDPEVTPRAYQELIETAKRAINLESGFVVGTLDTEHHSCHYTLDFMVGSRQSFKQALQQARLEGFSTKLQDICVYLPPDTLDKWARLRGQIYYDPGKPGDKDRAMEAERQLTDSIQAHMNELTMFIDSVWHAVQEDHAL